ncbi:MAG: amidohydrolase family protein [Deltaproteobacteria bacterium]|nr:amidohydrolase family protein [Deltaproteobacteria bacterium]
MASAGAPGATPLGVRTALTNIGTIVSGDLDRGVIPGEAILIEEGRIARIGESAEVGGWKAEVVLDALGTTVIPGLIDSHVHMVLGDYTPRQKAVDFLDSYVHGGVTTVISAGEGIHAPGRPHDAVAAKALAIAAAKCSAGFRPTGMKVVAGSVVLEPGLTEADFAEMARHGVRLAKVGFGQVQTPFDYEPLVRWAQQHGITVMAHTGGTSLPGSVPITEEHLLKMRPDVCGHANGGTTALTDQGVERLVRESDLVLQIVQAGNLRSALHMLKLAAAHRALSRILIASDTPTGTGLMPMALLKSIAELSSLGGLPAPQTIALATGNVARVYGLADRGTIEVGKAADLVVMDAPFGSAAKMALEAFQIGDIPGISAVLIDGEIRTLRSRNTPMATRLATLADARGDRPGGSTH